MVLAAGLAGQHRHGSSRATPRARSLALAHQRISARGYRLTAYNLDRRDAVFGLALELVNDALKAA